MRQIPVAFAIILPFTSLIGQDAAYINPLDGETYSAVWQKHSPTAEGERISVAGVRLLSSQQDFDKNVAPKKLEELNEAIKSNVKFVVGQPAETFDILMEITLSPRQNPKIAMASRGKVPSGTLEEVHKALVSIPDLRSRLQTLRYQIEISARKGEPDKDGVRRSSEGAK